MDSIKHYLTGKGLLVKRRKTGLLEGNSPKQQPYIKVGKYADEKKKSSVGINNRDIHTIVHLGYIMIV